MKPRCGFPRWGSWEESLPKSLTTYRVSYRREALELVKATMENTTSPWDDEQLARLTERANQLWGNLWESLYQGGSIVVATFLGWFLTVVIYLVFVIYLGLSRYGNIRLGPEHSRPDFNIFSWSAMLFSAGIGIGVIFFALAEPLTQFYNAPNAPEDQVAAARHAMELTFLHWGLSGWGIYTLVGMALAFFSYRHNLPLTISSALYPIFGDKIYGMIGHVVDTAAVLGTVDETRLFTVTSPSLFHY